MCSPLPARLFERLGHERRLEAECDRGHVLGGAAQGQQMVGGTQGAGVREVDLVLPRAVLVVANS